MILEKTAITEFYTAGSALAMLDGRLYLAGDNMGHILVLNKHLETTGTVVLTGNSPTPMPKATKADIEAAVVVQHKNKDKLMLIGSGSHPPYRNNAWIINSTGQTVRIDLTTFYDRIKSLGIKELNIEGAAALPGHILLSNRGNKTFPQNQLIITSADFWENQATAEINIKNIGPVQTAEHFSGVSGMDYSILTGSLLLTVSTEDTKDSYADGLIGKSFLWLINRFAEKQNNLVILPDLIIDLEKLDERFKGQKIETVCILEETSAEMSLALAADNDTGNTVLFKVCIDMDKVAESAL